MRSPFATAIMTTIAVLLPAAGLSQGVAQGTPQDTPEDLFLEARTAFDEGRFIQALEGFEALLLGPDGDAWTQRIALETGELFAVQELTADGEAVRWSPDGGFAAFETETPGGTVTTVLRLTVSPTGSRLEVVAELPGRGLAFSPDAAVAAYRRVDRSAAFEAELAALEAEYSGADWGARRRLQGEVAALEARYARVVLHDLGGGGETVIRPDGLGVGSVLYGPDGALHVLGTEDSTGSQAPSDPQVYRIDGDGSATPVSTGSGPKGNPFFAGGGEYLVYEAGRGTFGIENLATGIVGTFEGSVPVESSDGTTLAFLSQEEGEDVVITLPLGSGSPTHGSGNPLPQIAARAPFPVSTASSRACSSCPLLSGLSLSPDGRFAVVQARPREDWELFLLDLGEGFPISGEAGSGVAGSGAAGSGAAGSGAAGSGVSGSGRPTLVAPAFPGHEGLAPSFPAEDGLIRITREVQHDLYPVFLPDGRLLAMKGEGRHRRSHLYDLTTGEVIWLFRNNTLRTVAPEYEWAPSPDGTKLLIVAERDGNTVSPERGVYLMDLTRQVTREEVLVRIRQNLEAERDLRARTRAMYAPLTDEIRSAVDEISKTRLFTYQEALFQFGSKNVSQPGNALAIDYIADQLRGFGYEPELQWFDARGVESANVVVRIPGTVSPDVVYAVSAHFDSNTRSPGADDNTSATVGLLEMARVLADHPLPATLEIALFTGEESGLLGSREYVRRAVESGKNLVGALNNDMVGYAEDHRLDNTIRYSNAGIRDLQHGAAILFSDLVLHDAEYYKSTDAAAYYDAYGDIVGGIGSYPILASPHYHQSHDVLETINHQLVTEVAKVTTASAMLMASSPSRLGGLEAVRTGDDVMVTWTPAVEKDVVEYRVAWGPEDDPLQEEVTVTEAAVSVPGVLPGRVISVKAVNQRGMEGWDWARIVVSGQRP